MNFPTEQQVERIAKAMLKVSEPGCSDEWIESYWRKARTSEHHENAPITCDHCTYVEYMDNARAALTALTPEWREMEADKTRLDWCERQATDGLHIELCYSGSYSGTNLKKRATVFIGDEPHRCDNVRAAIDDAREREG